MSGRRHCAMLNRPRELSAQCRTSRTCRATCACSAAPGAAFMRSLAGRRPARIVATLRDGLPHGSYLVRSHATADFRLEAAPHAAAVYDRAASTVTSARLRADRGVLRRLGLGRAGPCPGAAVAARRQVAPPEGSQQDLGLRRCRPQEHMTASAGHRRAPMLAEGPAPARVQDFHDVERAMVPALRTLPEPAGNVPEELGKGTRSMSSGPALRGAPARTRCCSGSSNSWEARSLRGHSRPCWR